ncbi:MAG: hypothetical protein Q9218_002892 [Villophora microphyllina]
MAGIVAQSPVTKYEHAGLGLSCEATSLRDAQYLQDQLDVFNILRDFGSLMDDFDIRSQTSNAITVRPRLKNSLKWTASNNDVGTSYWHQTITDIPWQLGEGTRTSLLDTDLGVNPASTVIQEQFLSRHPSYENAILVRSLFQCYHREGYVLTMSPLAGTGIFDKYSLQNIGSRSGTRAANDNTSFIGHFMDKDTSSGNDSAGGTTGSPVKSTLWFVVAMLTDLLATPRKTSSGIPVPSIQRAYIPTVRDLINQKSRQTTRFKRNESVNLVRDYISCMDEMSQIQGIARRKIDFLERLRRDCENLKQYTDPANRHPGLTGNADADADTIQLIVKLIENAIASIRAEHAEFPEMLEDLKSSLHDLFQLRTIEQNELAIIAESNNKAILVFTVVTTVFLPLSFFTSYFGMNIKNTSAILNDQGYFWAVCGSITLVIVAFTMIYGFKNRLYGWVWGDRHASRGPDQTSDEAHLKSDHIVEAIRSFPGTRHLPESSTDTYVLLLPVHSDRPVPLSPLTNSPQSHHLVAFEHTPRESSPQPQNSLLFIPGLNEGFLTTPYILSLAAALPPTWSFIEVLLSSSYSGWGTSSLPHDISELAQCITNILSLPSKKHGKIVLMGNSTGCQDVLGYLSFPPTTEEERWGGERPRVEGGILQAPVSDREAIEMIYPKEDLERYNALARQFVKDGRGEEVLPNEVSLPLLGARTTASRWLSLSSPAPEHKGQDDMFSSDFSASRFDETFGMAGRRGAALMVLFSGNDGFVPKSVDKESLVERMEKAFVDAGGKLGKGSGVLPGASHTVKEEGDVREDLLKRVCGFLEDVEAGKL